MCFIFPNFYMDLKESFFIFIMEKQIKGIFPKKAFPTQRKGFRARDWIRTSTPRGAAA